MAAVQALSGTGACRLFADFQSRFLPGSKILIPSPTWSNHHNVSWEGAPGHWQAPPQLLLSRRPRRAAAWGWPVVPGPTQLRRVLAWHTAVQQGDGLLGCRGVGCGSGAWAEPAREPQGHCRAHHRNVAVQIMFNGSAITWECMQIWRDARGQEELYPYYRPETK